MSEAYWSAVRTMRLGIADLLDSLGPGEWDGPSLCRGWRIRDVAGHLSIIPTITTRALLAVAPRARFNLHRMNTAVAVRHGSGRPEAIVAVIREHAASRHTALVL